MATTNYSFTTINGTDEINLVSAINTPLQQIDTKIKEIADTIPGDDGGLGNRVTALESSVSTLQGSMSTLQSSVTALQETVAKIKSGKTYNDLGAKGFAYIDEGI